MPLHPLPLFAALAAALLLSGCQTHSDKSAYLDQTYRSGQLGAAVKEADRQAAKHANSPKDSIIWHLEQGAILRAAAASPAFLNSETAEANAKLQKPKKDEPAPEPITITTKDILKRSNAAFDLAEARVNEWEEKARVKIASETGATLTNLANLPYRGRAYDKIMLNTYKALNHMQLGDLDSARVELNRVFQRQAAAVAENAKRIAETQAELAQARSGSDTKGKGFDIEKTARYIDPARLNMAALETAAANAPYADYVNPFSVLLDAIFFSACAMDSDDLEHARKSFERLAAMSPGNPHAQNDLADLSAGKRPRRLTYIIFENGSAPYRQQEKLILPIALLTSGPAPNIVAAFPYLLFHNPAPPLPSLAANGSQNISPQRICDMDSIVARDFKNEWPSILTKTIASAAVKAIIDAAAQAAVKGATQNSEYGAFIQLATKIGTLAANVATTIADTRQWRSLPKEFLYARIPTPPDCTLTLEPTQQPAAQQPAATRKIPLHPAAVNIVLVKTIAQNVPPLITHFTLPPTRQILN